MNANVILTLSIGFAVLGFLLLCICLFSTINKKAKLSSKTSQELKSKIVENLEADIHFDGNAIQIKLQK